MLRFLHFQLRPRHKDLLEMIRRNKSRFVVAGASMLLIAVSTSLMGYLLKPVIDEIFVNRDAGSLLFFPLVVLAAFLLKSLGAYGQEYFLNYVAQDIIRQLRNKLYDRIQDLPLAFFQKERTGVLMSRITNDVNVLKSMVSSTVTSTLRDSASILGLATVIIIMNWRLALIAFVVLPVAFMPVWRLGRKVRRVSTSVQQAMGEMNAFLHETLAGNKIVKAFGRETHEKERFFKRSQEIFKLEIRSVAVSGLSSPILEAFGGLAIAFVIWYGGWEVIKGASTPGTFMAFLTSTMLMYEPIKKLSRLNNSIQEGLAATDRIYDIIEMPSTILDPPQPRPIPPAPYNLCFEDLCFSYGDTLVLKNINLQIASGEVLALVGMSGGGKSTLVNLIPRFFDPASGGVRIAGIDIREFAVAELRRQIAIVTQEPILFNETVRDNIAYGNPSASPQAVENAARAAYAHDFITRFPQGYDTMIGELGGRLSGGEKQRLCIARALLKNAPILILDEATSSLDSEAEAVVQKALENLMRGRTTVVIAHRLSTIAKADRIAVIVDGVVVEQGTHDQLLCSCGEYSKLHAMQYARKTAPVDLTRTDR